MFNKILIANRGEIACRIARTARRMGIQSVAVYSKADRAGLHVKQCDQAFFIGPARAADSYLRGERLIAAARKSGADAIHPGYGFLSENAEFAEMCARGGVVFIGPPAAAIRAMGSKSRAKQLMAAAGVPVAAGYHGEEQDAKTLQAAADEIAYPLLIKAVAGGGGKGMRVVERADEFAAALATVKRESMAAFADDRVLIEKYLPRARHVEVQVFADSHGNAVHLFDRDCSLQRRRQKVIEEAPAPDIDPRLREKMAAAALAAVRAMDGYIGAGTVEFLLDVHENAAADAEARFYFMEMNTRLQVEHPVTEMITGHDLVEWQLLAAAGQPLPCSQAALRINGHAMQARIYAENPANNFLPATGRLAVYRHAPACDWHRVDSGVGHGDEILPHYDALLAKLIVHGDNREAARRRLGNALARFDLAGVATNLEFLHALTELDDFITPSLSTALIEGNRATLFADKGEPPEMCLAIAALFESGAAAGNRQTPFQSGHGDIFSPWAPALPWQLNLPGTASSRFAGARGEMEYPLQFEGGQAVGFIQGERVRMALTRLQDGRFSFQHGEQTQIISVDKILDVIHINMAGRRWVLPVVNGAVEARDESTDEAALKAPMPGSVVAINVKQNQSVKRGQGLLILEAMKMEHTITAPRDGKVTQLFFKPGEQVREGDQLLALSELEPA